MTGRKAWLVLLACFGGGLANSAEAQENWPTRTVMTWGLGDDSCGKFNVAVAEHGPNLAMTSSGGDFRSAAYSYLQWIAGFLTAADIYGQMRSHTDLYGAYGSVAKFCADNPESSVWVATIDFLRRQQR